MASRRRRSRRSWRYRVRRGLSRHRRIAVRSALAVALLAEVWLLWPEPDHPVVDQRGAAGAVDQPITGGEVNDGLVAAAEASVAVSGKRQLVGAPAVLQDRLKQRLRQVARTMPDIGMPDPGPIGPTAAERNPPAGLSRAQLAVGSDVSAVLAGTVPGAPATAVVGAGAAAQQATTAQRQEDGSSGCTAP